MKTVKLVCLLVMSLLLSSCNDPEVTGKLILSKTVNMFKETSKKAIPVEIAAGEYKAVARLRDKNRSLYLQILDDRENPNIKFELPVRFPDQKGEFKVTPKEAGQPFGLHGIVKSQSHVSETVNKWESCPLNCFPSGGYPNPPGPSCTPGSIGYQRVRFHMKFTQTQYEVNLEGPDGVSVGAFHAMSDYSEKIYDFKGICM